MRQEWRRQLGTRREPERLPVFANGSDPEDAPSGRGEQIEVLWLLNYSQAVLQTPGGAVTKMVAPCRPTAGARERM